MSLRFNHDNRIQRGKGLGGLLRVAGSLFKPFIKNVGAIAGKAIKSNTGQRVLNSIKKQAIESGKNVIEDVLAGNSLSDSASNELESVKHNMKTASLESLNNLLNKKSVASKRKLKSQALPPIKRRRIKKIKRRSTPIF